MNPARVLGPAIISGYFQHAENSVLTHAVSINNHVSCVQAYQKIRVMLPAVCIKCLG